MRLKAHTDDVKKIHRAYLEANGDISFIRRKEPPRVIEVRLDREVAVVRVQLDD